MEKRKKYKYLDEFDSKEKISWTLLNPTSSNIWLTDDLENDFELMMPLGIKPEGSGFSRAKEHSQTSKETIFGVFSSGAQTNRDVWAYNFNSDDLAKNISLSISTYNEQLYRWKTQKKLGDSLDEFLLYDDSKIKWSSSLKGFLSSGIEANFEKENVRRSIFRPFVHQYLYFDKVFTHRTGLFFKILPNQNAEEENYMICVPNFGGRTLFWSLCTNLIPHTTLTSVDMGQYFPFYIYDEDGSNRRENITDWALEQFQTHYQDPSITKWDIFHYTYAVLHHPHYRTRYAANLKRELPRIPFAPEFRPFATAGKRLAEIHVKYEDQPEYRLKHQENKDLPIDWRVEKMRLSKDKTQLKYNDFLTLTGIPPEAFEYRLGNRSALDWVIDQYQVKTDKRSGITNDPNRLDDEKYIVRLIKKVITVSLETVAIVNGLPDLGLPND